MWNRKLRLTGGNNKLGASSKCGFAVSLVGTLVPASTKMWAGFCNACWQPGQQTVQSRGKLQEAMMEHADLGHYQSTKQNY